MEKRYLFIIIFCLFSFWGFSQSFDIVGNTSSEIENLSIYPNPASQGYIHITSKNNAPKKVEILNVLGKHILTVTMSQKALNISKLKAGVYIIKITENNITVTRKLIVK
jgi:hypothetical protein